MLAGPIILNSKKESTKEEATSQPTDLYCINHDNNNSAYYNVLFLRTNFILYSF